MILDEVQNSAKNSVSRFILPHKNTKPGVCLGHILMCILSTYKRDFLYLYGTLLFNKIIQNTIAVNSFWASRQLDMLPFCVRNTYKVFFSRWEHCIVFTHPTTEKHSQMVKSLSFFIYISYIVEFFGKTVEKPWWNDHATKVSTGGHLAVAQTWARKKFTSPQGDKTIK